MKLYSLIFLVTITTMFSCTEKNDVILNTTDTDLSNLIMPKVEYNSSKSNVQKEFWINRLEYTSTLEVSQVQKDILDRIIVELKQQSIKDFKLTSDLQTQRVEAIKNFTKDDFLSIFCSVNALPEIKNSGNICERCLVDIQNIKEENFVIVTDKQDLPPCNCRWTCDSYLSGPIACSHTECKETLLGCGFLALGSCNGRDEINAENCPEN